MPDPVNFTTRSAASMSEKSTSGRQPERPEDQNPDSMATQSVSQTGSAISPERVGSYRTIRELGRGGMGIVYLAEDPKLQRPVAVKVLSPRIARDPVSLQRFEREARLLAALSHPNIAVIHALEEWETGPFLVMEFVPGETLSDRLARAPLTLEESLHVARQIAAALEAAHEKGVVHRDLKPGNVRIRPDARISVLDFGLAKLEGQHPGSDDTITARASIVGTPGYISPEQLRGEAVDHRADVWAFGCVLYECLAGVRAFRAPTPSGRMAATLEREPDWDRLPNDTPERIRRLLQECLCKVPDDRLDRISSARRAVEEELAPGGRAPTPSSSWTGPRVRPRSLPRPLTSFVGREDERDEARRLLGESRLLTIIGAGGTGKSRLAIELTSDMADKFEDGACWVELAALSDVTLLPQTVASALQLRERARRSATEVVLDHLRDKELLLALDNCEHLLPDCSRFAFELLRAAERVRLLATSREPLSVGGERVYPLSPLPVPPLDRSDSLEAIQTVDSVRLFDERARSADPEFRIMPENVAAVAELCRRVDGIPLALELAAARVRTLSPAEIVSRLDERLSILVSPDRTILPRHRTMGALLDWSYDLLSESERSLYRRLSVFAGSWTLEAAESVCLGGSVPRWEFLDLFSHLVDKSLVERDRSSKAGREIARYRFLEPVREHALALLRENREHHELRARHRRHFLSIAEAAEEGLNGVEQAEWLVRLEMDHDNFRAALEPMPDDPEDEVSRLKLAGALGRFWWHRGLVAEGLSHCDKVTADPATREHVDAWASVCTWKAWLLMWFGDFMTARRVAEEACDVCRRTGHQQQLMAVMSALAGVHLYSGDPARAEATYEEVCTLARQLGSERIYWGAIGNLGEVLYRRGNYRRSFILARDCNRRIWTEASPFNRAEGLRNIARPAAKLGKRRVARRWLEQSLAISRDIEDRWGMASSLELLAGLDADAEQPVRSACLLGAADLFRSSIHAPISPAETAEISLWTEAAKRSLGRDAFQAAWDRGRAMELGDLVELACGGGRSGRPASRDGVGTRLPSR